MINRFLRITFFWGFVLWLIGYILGIVLFALVPQSMLGWVIMPFGIIFTLLVLQNKVKANLFHLYVLIAIIWTLIAIVCDYFFLVKVFKPVDGYYKLDVYLYYILTFLLPIFVGKKKMSVK